jgi:RNA polymerase sigma factor (sigma-70 family)
MQRWASGRLPPWARGLSGTDDIVQEALVATLRTLSDFEPEHEAALSVYLRQAVASRLLNEVRRARRKPAASSLDEADLVAGRSLSPSPAQQDRRDAYESALLQLSAEDREAIVGRIEFNYSYRELAEAWGKPTPDAARKTVERAVLRLAALLRP